MVDQWPPVNQRRRQSHHVATIAALVIGLVDALIIGYVATIVASLVVFVVVAIVPLPRQKKYGR